MKFDSRTWLLVAAFVFTGCPPVKPAIQADMIDTPVDLQAYDVDLMISPNPLASIPVHIDLNFSASALSSVVIELLVDDPNVPNSQETWNNITSGFSISYPNETAVGTLTPGQGWYILRVHATDTADVTAEDSVIFSAEYPGPDFEGTAGTNLLLLSSLAGVEDGCFGGLLNFLVNGDGNDNFLVNFAVVPSYDDVLDATEMMSAYAVAVGVPELLDESGSVTFWGIVANNALLFFPSGIDFPESPQFSADLSQLLGGLVPCVLEFDVFGTLRRSGENTGDPRLVLHHFGFSDPPGGGHCPLQPPEDENCLAILDFMGFAIPIS